MKRKNQFSTSNKYWLLILAIICIVLMVVCVWIGSMVVYDKIIQLIKQIAESKGISDGEKRD